MSKRQKNYREGLDQIAKKLGYSSHYKLMTAIKNHSISAVHEEGDFKVIVISEKYIDDGELGLVWKQLIQEMRRVWAEIGAD